MKFGMKATFIYKNIHILMMAENKKKIGCTMGGVSYLNFARLSAGVLILTKNAILGSLDSQ